MSFFENLSALYRSQFADRWWKWYAEEPTPKRGAALFVGGYGFERQGRAASYPHAAFTSIVDAPEPLDADLVWTSFQDALGGKPMNVNLNPLRHQPTDCSCLICTFTANTGLEDVVAFARSELAADRTAVASTRLLRVRGTGPKIAAFFLRDVATVFGLEPKSGRILLQPVDVWVRRIVEQLGGKTGGDEQTAEWICHEASHPEKANQGMWYFASIVAGSDVRLRSALADEHYARELTREHMNRLRSTVKTWDEVVVPRLV